MTDNRKQLSAGIWNLSPTLAFLPNFLTLSRIALAPVVFWFLISGRLLGASVLFLIAGLSDWADGWLARTYSWQSRLGKMLDPVADKLLVFLTCLGLSLTGMIPSWLFYVIIGRDILILICATVALVNSWHITLDPSWISKANTALQFSLILDCLVSPFFSNYPSYFFFANEMIYTVAITTVVSGIDYAYRFLRQLPHR